MNTPPRLAFPVLLRRYILQTAILTVLTAYLVVCAYELVHNYQNKRQSIQQLATILTNRASAENETNTILKQVNHLLDADPNIQSIVFYSNHSPLTNIDQNSTDEAGQDWRHALFSQTISFNYAVTKPDSDISYSKDRSSTTPDNDNTLIGYINITLDLNKLRMEWLRHHILLWLIVLTVSLLFAFLALYRLKNATNDVGTLAKVCDSVLDNYPLKQLVIMQKPSAIAELNSIRLALNHLFSRLHTAESQLSDLADFEEQLRNKSLSLDIQRSNFQGMITHELKTSLNAISGSLQLLNPQTLNEEQKDILAIIRQGSEHLDNTLEQIIQLNKIEKGQVGISITEFNPLQLLSDLLADFEFSARQKGLELISRVQHTDHTVEGDSEKIKQILSTLIDNAIKFTMTGQVIIESQLDYFSNSIRWQIKVIDTGVGIEAKYIDDIFSPFFQVDPSHTREYAGLGVGLPLIKQIAQLMETSISVKSEFGLGSEFIVAIPLRNLYQNEHHTLLKDKKVVYIYRQNIGFIVEELQRFGVSVTCQQYEMLTVEQLMMISVDIVMIAEDVSPELAIQLARNIREQETTHRVVLVYCYPLQKSRVLEKYSYSLQAFGVDYCHPATRDTDKLLSLLSQWLI